MQIYKFRDCLLNTVERSVIRGREHIELTTKTFDVLQFLIENGGKVVTKDELLGNVWNGNFVEESNLPVHISKLRRSLNETRDNRFIETVQGTGYRFVAPVHEVQEAEWHRGLRPNENFAAVSLVCDGSGFHSIAVLPLNNDTGVPENTYLVDGLSESLINGLSHIPGVKVIARNTMFRYKDKDVDFRELAVSLQVSRILTGRIRLVDDQLLVAVELTNAADGTHVWGAQYNRPFSKIVNIHQEIVYAVSRNLTTGFAAMALADPPYTENAESYKFYLKGNYFLRKRTANGIYKAIEYFQKSVSFCPANLTSYVSIVDAYHFLYVLERISRDEALRKIQPILEILKHLTQSLDVLQLMKGRLKLHLDWKHEAAAVHFRNALSLNPNLVEAHCFYAEVMMICGKESEALKHAAQILALDPISLLSFKHVARIFYKLGQYNNALVYLNDAFEMEPTDYEILLLLGAVHSELGEFDYASECLIRSYDINPNVETLSMIGYVCGLAGRMDAATQVIGRIRVELKDYEGHAVNLARVYASMGEKEEAFRFLERAYAQRALDMYALGIDPRWKNISTDPRFQSLVDRINSSGEST